MASLHRGFEVYEQIGRGAFGRVHRAKDLTLERIVALKVLDQWSLATEDERARFLREARTLASLDHPNIVRIHAVDEADGALRLSLEFVEGQTLQQVVERTGPLAPAETTHVGIDLCRALAAIHAKGLVHRDVKPANVMRASGGRVVLLDFGLVHATPDAASSGADATSGLRGTPLFMAPEQMVAGAPVTPRSDVYALGVTLYWLLTRSYPWDVQHDLTDLRSRKQRGEVVPLVDRRHDVPSALVEVLEQAMDADSNRRFASAGAMEQALRRTLETDARRSNRTVARLARARRATIVAVGLGACASVVEWFRQNDQLARTTPMDVVIYGATAFVIGLVAWLVVGARTGSSVGCASAVRRGAILGALVGVVSGSVAYVLVGTKLFGALEMAHHAVSIESVSTVREWIGSLPSEFGARNGWAIVAAGAAFGALVEWKVHRRRGVVEGAAR